MFSNIFLFFYTDPGSGALLLQVIMASIVGGLFYFRKLRDKILGKTTTKKLEVKAKN